MLKKNQASQKTISRLKEEQKAKFPIWSNRPTEIQNAIQAEQDSIHFREQRFSKILEEEGFSDFVDFQQESQILRQMESEQEQIEKQIPLTGRKYRIIPADMKNFADICLKTRFFQRNSGLRKTNPYTNMHKRQSHISSRIRDASTWKHFPVSSARQITD